MSLRVTGKNELELAKNKSLGDLEKTSPQGTCFFQFWKKQVPRGLVFSTSVSTCPLLHYMSTAFRSHFFRLHCRNFIRRGGLPPLLRIGGLTLNDAGGPS